MTAFSFSPCYPWVSAVHADTWRCDGILTSNNVCIGRESNEPPPIIVCQEANCNGNLGHCRHEDGAAEPKRAQAQAGGVVLQAIKLSSEKVDGNRIYQIKTRPV
jgi:hypothetical protein